MAKLSYPILRHWLPSTLFVLCAIVFYSQSPLYGADPTPTPNVSTVPKPGQLFTPTPAPVIAIITSEAPPAATSTAPDNASADNNDGTVDTQPGSVLPATNPNSNLGAGTNAHSTTANLPIAPGAITLTGVIIAEQVNLRQAPNTSAAILATLTANTAVTLLGRTETADWFYLCCGGQLQQNGWVSAPFVQITGDRLTLPIITGLQSGGGATREPTVALTVAMTPTLIWQGGIVHLHVMVQNTSAITLTNLTLRQPLPTALRYQTGTSDQAGALSLETATDNSRQVRINWTSLPPAMVATALVTLQVEPTAPNGLLFDSRAVVESSEGAMAAVALTLVMPPATLPNFGK